MPGAQSRVELFSLSTKFRSMKKALFLEKEMLSHNHYCFHLNFLGVYVDWRTVGNPNWARCSLQFRGRLRSALRR